MGQPVQVHLTVTGYVGLVYKKAIQKWKKGTTVLTI